MILYSDKSPERLKRYAYMAMCDAFRCVKVDPLYVKGYDRYAMALAAMDRTEVNIY